MAKHTPLEGRDARAKLQRRHGVEAFERQSAEYKEEVLPKAMKASTTAVEAGVTAAWYKYADKVLGVDDFGLSAPGDQVFEEKGITTAGLVAFAK